MKQMRVVSFLHRNALYLFQVKLIILQESFCIEVYLLKYLYYLQFG